MINRRHIWMLLCVLLLAQGLQSAHWHDDAQRHGDCITCQSGNAGDAQIAGAAPLLFIVAASAAISFIHAVPPATSARAGFRPRAPPRAA